MLWLVVFVIAACALVLSFFSGPNAIWGAAILGLGAGLIWGLVTGQGISLILRGFAVGAVVGLGAEILGLIGARIGARDPSRTGGPR